MNLKDMNIVGSVYYNYCISYRVFLRSGVIRMRKLKWDGKAIVYGITIYGSEMAIPIDEIKRIEIAKQFDDYEGIYNDSTMIDKEMDK